MTSVLYLTPGCFDKGGISRYSRFQIAALRDRFGSDAVSVFSVLGPGDDSFEEPIETTFAAGGVEATHKARFIARAIRETARRRPSLVCAAHLNLSGLAHTLARSVGAVSLLNVYGCEVWSGMRADARWGLAKADHIISDCHFTASYLKTRGVRKNDATTVIWDCVDTQRLTPGPASPATLARYGIPDPATGTNILTLGRLSHDAAYKGYERLLQAFAALAPRFPGLRLVFAGRGDLVPHLCQVAAQESVSDRVFFTGMIDDSDMADVYRSAHVFSLVTDQGVGRGEGLPLTPLEAAACGVPILVGNQDGSQEAVIEAKNGFVLDPFDRAAHVEKLALLASNEPLRCKMGEAALARVRAEFSYEVFLEKHRSLCARLLPEARR